MNTSLPRQKRPERGVLDDLVDHFPIIDHNSILRLEKDVLAQRIDLLRRDRGVPESRRDVVHGVHY